MKVRLKGLHSSTFTKGGVSSKYFYAWRGGPRLEKDGTPITDKNDPLLVVAFTKAHESAKRRSSEDLNALIAAFLISGEFKKLGEYSKRDYLKYIKRISLDSRLRVLRGVQPYLTGLLPGRERTATESAIRGRRGGRASGRISCPHRCPARTLPHR